MLSTSLKGGTVRSFRSRGSRRRWCRFVDWVRSPALALITRPLLLQAIAATGTSVVVVLVHGGALAIEWTQANIPAIIDAHYPGELGGDVR